jgi:hypothetical protein
MNLFDIEHLLLVQSLHALASAEGACRKQSPAPEIDAGARSVAPPPLNPGFYKCFPALDVFPLYL